MADVEQLFVLERHSMPCNDSTLEKTDYFDHGISYTKYKRNDAYENVLLVVNTKLSYEEMKVSFNVPA